MRGRLRCRDLLSNFSSQQGVPQKKPDTQGNIVRDATYFEPVEGDRYVVSTEVLCKGGGNGTFPMYFCKML